MRQRQALGVLITTVCLSLALPLAAAEPAKGVHRPLTIGELFVPEAYKPDGNAITRLRSAPRSTIRCVRRKRSRYGWLRT